MRNLVQHRGHVAREVCVPGVRVNEVRSLDVRDYLQVSRKGLQRRIFVCEGFWGLIAKSSRLGAWSPKGMNSCIDLTPEHLHQLSDVNACAPIDVGRVLFGNKIHTHTQMLSPVYPSGLTFGYGYPSFWNGTRRRRR